MIIRIIAIVWLLAFIPNLSDAQVERRKGFIGLALGPSAPLGDYADKEFNNTEAGFATTGISLNINFNYRFSRKFGVGILWKGDAHPVDEEQILELYAENDPGADWYLRTKPWSTGSFMAGLTYTAPLDNIEVYLRALIGPATIATPEMFVISVNDDKNQYITQHSTNAASLGTNLGVGMNFPLSDALNISMYMDYFRSKPVVDVMVTSGEGDIWLGEYTQPVRMLNFTLGIGYRFGKNKYGDP